MLSIKFFFYYFPINVLISRGFGMRGVLLRWSLQNYYLDGSMTKFLRSFRNWPLIIGFLAICHWWVALVDLSVYPPIFIFFSQTTKRRKDGKNNLTKRTKRILSSKPQQTHTPTPPTQKNNFVHNGKTVNRNISSSRKCNFFK